MNAISIHQKLMYRYHQIAPVVCMQASPYYYYWTGSLISSSLIQIQESLDGNPHCEKFLQLKVMFESLQKKFHENDPLKFRIDSKYENILTDIKNTQNMTLNKNHGNE